MGATQAAGYAEAVAEGAVSLASALNAHRVSNLYPSPPAYMVDTWIEAIEAMQDEDPSRDVILPGGVTYKGQTWAYAYEVIEGYRLEAFV